MDCFTKVTRTGLGLFLDCTPTRKARSMSWLLVFTPVSKRICFTSVSRAVVWSSAIPSIISCFLLLSFLSCSSSLVWRLLGSRLCLLDSNCLSLACSPLFSSANWPILVSIAVILSLFVSTSYCTPVISSLTVFSWASIWGSRLTSSFSALTSFLISATWVSCVARIRSIFSSIVRTGWGVLVLTLRLMLARR